MHDSNLVRVLARQSKTKVGLVDLATAHARGGRGPGAACRSRRSGYVAPPSSTPCSTATLKPSAPSRSDTGCRSAPPASGLGWRGRSSPARRQLPATHGRRRSAAWRRVSPAVARRRRSGKLRAPRQVMPVLHLDPDQVVTGKDEARRALAWARERLGSGARADRLQRHAGAGRCPCSRVTAATPLVTPSSRPWPTSPKAGAIRRARLVVAGGETSGAVVDRLLIPGFLVGVEIAPGVPVLRAVGAKAMLLALKSGNFGGPAILLRRTLAHALSAGSTAFSMHFCLPVVVRVRRVNASVG